MDFRHSRHNRRNDDDDDDRSDYQQPNFNQPSPTFPGGFRNDDQPPPPNFQQYNQPPPTFPGGFRNDDQPSNYHHQHHNNSGGGGRGGFRQDDDEPPFSSVTHHQHNMPSPPNPIRSDYYGGGEENIGGGGGGGGYQPPPPSFNHFQPGPPPVQHVSHHLDDRPSSPPHHFPHRDHQHQHHGASGAGGHSNFLPSFSHHQSSSGGPGPANPELTNKPTVRVYSKADTNYSLTIKDSQVVLSPSNPRDDFQHWIKDQKFSTKVKDEEGFPCFALVNKATGQALKHSIAATQPVQLVPYNPNAFDESVLWTESRDLGDSYRCIRMVNNIRLNLDAFNGDQNHGGVRDGTIAVLWEWKKGDNQRWKIAPY